MLKLFNGFSCDVIHVIYLHCTSAGYYDALSDRYFTCPIAHFAVQSTLSYLKGEGLSNKRGFKITEVES